MQSKFIKRRIIALSIDAFVSLVVSIPILILMLLICDYVIQINTVVMEKIYIAAFMLIFSFKDIVFKNGSIGKKLLSIRIVCKNTYEIPSKKTMILRGFITIILYVINATYLFIKGETLADKLLKTTIEAK